MTYCSIWEDVYCVFSGYSEFLFAIQLDGEIIYAGRSVAEPNQSDARINVTRILRNIPNCNLETFGEGTTDNERALIEVQVLDYQEMKLIEEFKILYCWDYKTSLDTIWDIDPYYLSGISTRINDKTANGMYSATTVIHDGVSTTITGITSGNSCGDYAIYYCNAKGGWDQFLLQGNCKRTDTHQRLETVTPWDAGSMHGGRRGVSTDIYEEWECKTGILSDKENERLMEHLIGTPCAFFHDIRNSRMFPCVVETNTAEFKTFRNNGRKFFTATFKIRNSHDRQRL